MRISARTTLSKAALAVTTLALVGAGAFAAPADAATPEAEGAADWLSDQLTNGVLMSGGFAQYGPTLDAYFAMKGLRVLPSQRQEILDNLASHVADYVGAGNESYAGPTGKLATAALMGGRDATAFGGENLIVRLKDLVRTGHGAQRGRASDDSQFGDFSNTFGQSWVVRTFARSDRAPMAGITTKFLLKQQCNAGFFRESLDSSDYTCQTGRGEGVSAPSVDATALAVAALRDARRTGVKGLGNDIADALSWLNKHQNANGSFTGNGVSNANSTGLAAQALAATHPGAANQAAAWVGRRQVTADNADGTQLAGEEGAIAYNQAAFEDGADEGITDGSVLNQWFLATAQAAEALNRLP